MTESSTDGGRLPPKATCMGGKGADGLHHYILVGNDGSLNVTPAAGGATAANQATQITAEQAIQATAGAVAGAAVITDANGTLQQYLRGLVKLAITAGGWLVTASITSFKGAGNLATSQVTATGTAATLVAARATRRSVLFTNTHASASCWVGPATVAANTGQRLGPGESCPFTWVGLFQVIDDGVTHPVVCVSDEYD